eukprot:scaffold208508_cov75-Attheya_sp.AAC.1
MLPGVKEDAPIQGVEHTEANSSHLVLSSTSMSSPEPGMPNKETSFPVQHTKYIKHEYQESNWNLMLDKIPSQSLSWNPRLASCTKDNDAPREVEDRHLPQRR